jgi:hypothetical protein
LVAIPFLSGGRASKPNPTPDQPQNDDNTLIGNISIANHIVAKPSVGFHE